MGIRIRHQFSEVPNRKRPRGMWFPEGRLISRLWRTATQNLEPQLLVTKALIVNYTFGTGAHFWDGCKCTTCGATRRSESTQTALALRVRDIEHLWSGCKCTKCGCIRDSDHTWCECKCAVCGSTRDGEHNWQGTQCQKCGKQMTDRDLVQNLKDKGDYRTLVERVGGRDEGWRAKYALMEAGAPAVDAVLERLKRSLTDNRVPHTHLADILVRIGDPKAVPLMKKILDRGDFDAHAPAEYEKFVNMHPHLHGPEETVRCAGCGKIRPITLTRNYGDTTSGRRRFCKASCWDNRGSVLAPGIGKDCPWYTEGICMAGGKDTGLCSLQVGSYRSCNVYLMHPK